VKIFYIWFVILITCFDSQSFANSTTSISLRSILASANKEMIAGRFRVQPEELILNEKGIFVNLAGKFLPIDNLASDEIGLYCFFGEGDDEGDRLWECSYCHTLNRMDRKKCKKCGTWR
jgi:hypothetical protein